MSPYIETRLNQYLEDLKHEEWCVTLELWNNENNNDADSLKDKIKEIYNKHHIKGCVLIGDLPYKEFTGYYYFKNKEKTYRTYMDKVILDLYFSNPDKDVFNFINATNIEYSSKPKIWISRISPPENSNLFPNKTKADLINAYLKKNHEYRTSQGNPIKKKTAYSFSCWDGRILRYFLLAKYYKILSQMDDGFDFLNLIEDEQINTLFLFAHSETDTHFFGNKCNEQPIQSISSEDIVKTKVTPRFIYLNSCHACNYTYSQSLSHAYLYAEQSETLVVIGLTGTEDIENYIKNNPTLKFKGNIGEEFLNFYKYDTTLYNWMFFQESAINTIGITALTAITTYLLQFLPNRCPLSLTHKTYTISQIVAGFSFLINVLMSSEDYPQITYTLLGDGTLRDNTNLNKGTIN